MTSKRFTDEFKAEAVKHPSWPEQREEAPSWKDFALFLLMGKIYE